ncbi:hypothetical protein [Pedobacter sp. V48]|uniref:hypothetical protein n=1 Tax=Pedobacter sp. V48 TaxID=509635 RepID=UPI0003E4651C|nr:hypothetical protein [Pedobacter sp. V48]ETZ21913.1 hypothetical protein N824_25790 [Pedobacter sp. V48]
MFRSFLLLLIPVLLFSCNYPGEGSLGGWASITFPIEKDKFKLAVESFRNANPENEIPERWQYDSEHWTRDVAGIKEGEVLYDKKDQEQMFFFSYIPTDNQNKTTTTIALRSVFRNGTWHRKKVLDTAEQKRISKQFYEKVVAKLELITNTKSRSEKEKYEQPDNDHEDVGNNSDFVLTVATDKNIEEKKELNIKEKSDSIGAILKHGKFDVSTVNALERICPNSEDIAMQSFTTTVEDLFYTHMASFTNYYIANPNSCLKAKLKQSMEEYMAAYEAKDRMTKHIEKEKRILKKAEREHFSPKQLTFLHTLLNSINLNLKK